MTETRPQKTLAKLERMNKALRHEEPDRIPIGEFFWGSFINRWRRKLNLPDDADPYQYYDLDWIVTTPNMDPHIKPFETLRETDEEVVVRTGFEAVVRKRFDLPMPEAISWETDTIEKLDGYNPLKAKAGLDVVDLRRQYGHTLAFCGNGNIQVWETGDEPAVRREVLRKLNAAKGGGFIFQSDHSVSSGVSGHTYDYIVKLVREFGQYPLELGEYDEEI
jgi:hypothetical protein